MVNKVLNAACDHELRSKAPQDQHAEDTASESSSGGSKWSKSMKSGSGLSVLSFRRPLAASSITTLSQNMGSKEVAPKKRVRVEVSSAEQRCH